MRLHLQAEARHAYRVFNALLSIDHVAARNHVDYLAVGRNSNCPRYLNRPADIVLDDIAMNGRDGDKALAIVGLNMAASDANVGRCNCFSRKAFSTIQRRCNGSDSFFDVHHHPRRNPCEGQVPTPTMFSFPSRSSSPTRTQIFVVPTSIPTITRSCTIHAPMGGCLGTPRVPSHYKLRITNLA